MITYFVVQPFENTHRGMVAGRAREVHGGSGAAIALAKRLAEKGGAVAFSRTGDLSSGEFEDATILGVFGDVPEDAAEMAAASA